MDLNPLIPSPIFLFPRLPGVPSCIKSRLLLLSSLFLHLSVEVVGGGGRGPNRIRLRV